MLPALDIRDWQYYAAVQQYFGTRDVGVKRHDPRSVLKEILKRAFRGIICVQQCGEAAQLKCCSAMVSGEGDSSYHYAMHGRVIVHADLDCFYCQV